MGKTFETKSKIIGLLRVGQKTLTQLYTELGLSPATVCQHLQELCNAGILDCRNDEHFRKLKYYSLSQAYIMQESSSSQFVARVVQG